MFVTPWVRHAGYHLCGAASRHCEKDLTGLFAALDTSQDNHDGIAEGRLGHGRLRPKKQWLNVLLNEQGRTAIQRTAERLRSGVGCWVGGLQGCQG